MQSANTVSIDVLCTPYRRSRDADGFPATKRSSRKSLANAALMTSTSSICTMVFHTATTIIGHVLQEARTTNHLQSNLLFLASLNV